MKMGFLTTLPHIVILFLVQQQQVEAVVASEWSFPGSGGEYVMAVINVTYLNNETKLLHPTKKPSPEFGREIGKFGNGKIAGVHGVLLHAHSRRLHDGKVNPYGCEPIENVIPKDRPWIALIKRGNCHYDKKLENAQIANASAMLVYDLEDRDTLGERMELSNCKNCTIPGIFTYKRIGEELANIVENGTHVEIYIGVGETCIRPYGGINRTSVLFVSISFIVLMIISLAWLVFYYVQRFRYLHAKDRLAQRLCTAAKKALAKIPLRNVKVTDKEITEEPECCAICIEFYVSGDILRTLPCRHEFHRNCVDPWLLEHRTCPMCKIDILKYYGFVFTGSQESILHLDLEDGFQNSSDSRDMDSPTQNHAPIPIRYAESTDRIYQLGDNAHSSTNFCPQHSQQDGTRKPSLISLTVVASSRGQCVTNVTTPTDLDAMTPTSGTYSCRCYYEKGVSTIPGPICFVHDDARSHNSMEDTSSEASGVHPNSHQPLIHREDSSLGANRQWRNANSHHASNGHLEHADPGTPTESESHIQDLNNAEEESNPKPTCV